MADPLSPHQQHDLRLAAALAIASRKRKCAQEAAEWKAKAQRLEAELLEQQAKQSQLKQWVQSVVAVSSGTGPEEQEAPQAHSDSTQPSAAVFLPPLSLAAAAAYDSQLQSHPVPGDFQALQQQVALATQTAAAAGAASQASMLDGRAAVLTSMLLTNVQMLQQLSAPSRGGGMQRGRASDTICSISAFVTGTLLHAPKSSLSTAYMRQCAMLLAAVLAPAASSSQPAEQGAHPQDPDSPYALAVLVLDLLQQLLELRAAAVCHPPGSAASSCSTLMLQQLSAFPSTALLLCLAAAQRLQQHVLRVQEASATVLGVSLETFSSTPAGEQALVTGSNECLAAHELLLDMEAAVLQVPVWGVALASSSWTASALQDLVAAAAAMYQACGDLQALQPLLAGRICSLCASLATALQQLAADADAPGMRVGAGSELRSAVGCLCVKLRDLFMPAG